MNNIWVTLVTGGSAGQVAAVEQQRQNYNAAMRNARGQFTSRGMNDNSYSPVQAVKHLFKMPDAEKSKTKYLRTHASPSCCGIDWIISFPELQKLNGKYDYDHNEHYKTDIDEDLTKIFKASQSTWEVMGETRTNNIMLVVLNNVQRTLYHDILLKHKFKVIQEPAYTDKTGHLLTIYSFLRHPTIKEATDK